jgi:hypothetical protein
MDEVLEPSDCVIHQRQTPSDSNRNFEREISLCGKSVQDIVTDFKRFQIG